MKELLQESWTLAKRDYKRHFSILNMIGLIIISLALLIGISIGLDKFIRLPEGVSYFEFFPTGFIAYMVAIMSFNVGLSVVEDKNRFMKLVFVAPVSRLSIFFGKIIHTLLNAAFVYTFIGLGVLAYIGELSVPRIFFMIVMILLIVHLFMGLGLFLAVFIEKMATFQAINGGLLMFFLFFSGIVYPISALPSWLRIITYVNPLTYAADATAFALTGTSTIPFSIFVVLFLAIVLPILAIYFFERKMRS
ncbi:MAG: ABC transporter permease [Nanoarchaeota archaeon]